MKKINKSLINITFISLSLCFASTAMAKIYKWTDANGKTHYTATPPPAKAKAKTKEFKVQRTKQSSLTNTAFAESNTSDSSTNNASSNQNNMSAKTGDNAQSQCSKALRKYPAVLSKLKRKLNQGKTSGEIGEADYQLAMQELQKEESKVQSMADCVKDYKRGGKEKNSVNLVANNSAEDALTYMMLGAAFEQAAQDSNITKKQ